MKTTKTLSSGSGHSVLNFIFSGNNFSVFALLVDDRLVHILFFVFRHLLGCALSPWDGIMSVLDLRVSVFK